MKKETTLVLYHKEDADGLVSASIIYCWLYGLNWSTIVNRAEENLLNDYMKSLCDSAPNSMMFDDKKIALPNGRYVKFVGTTYATLSDMVLNAGSSDKLIKKLKENYDNIIMTDISFNEVDVMYKLYKEYGDNMLWFDHHNAIIRESYSDTHNFSNIDGLRGSSTSALMLAYYYCYGRKNYVTLKDCIEAAPNILQNLAGYDSWQPESHGTNMKYAFSFNRGFEYNTKLDFNECVRTISYLLFETIIDELNMYDMNLMKQNNVLIYNKINEYWRYVNIYVDDFCLSCDNDGDVVVETTKQMWKRMVNEFGDTTFTTNGENTVVLVSQIGTSSLMFDFLKKTNIEHVCIFKKLPTDNKEKQWAISLYNVNDDSTFNVGVYLKERYNGGGHYGAGGATISQSTFDNIMLTKFV